MKQIVEYYIVDHGLQWPNFSLPKESPYGPNFTYVLGIGYTPMEACYFAVRGLAHVGFNTGIIVAPKLKGCNAKDLFKRWKNRSDNPLWHVAIHIREAKE
jgi:hypothetical protein